PQLTPAVRALKASRPGADRQLKQDQQQQLSQSVSQWNPRLHDPMPSRALQRRLERSVLRRRRAVSAADLSLLPEVERLETSLTSLQDLGQSLMDISEQPLREEVQRNLSESANQTADLRSRIDNRLAELQPLAEEFRLLDSDAQLLCDSMKFHLEEAGKPLDRLPLHADEVQKMLDEHEPRAVALMDTCRQSLASLTDRSRRIVQRLPPSASAMSAERAALRRRGSDAEQLLSALSAATSERGRRLATALDIRRRFEQGLADCSKRIRSLEAVFAEFLSSTTAADGESSKIRQALDEVKSLADQLAELRELQRRILAPDRRAMTQQRRTAATPTWQLRRHSRLGHQAVAIRSRLRQASADAAVTREALDKAAAWLSEAESELANNKDYFDDKDFKEEVDTATLQRVLRRMRELKSAGRGVRDLLDGVGATARGEEVQNLRLRLERSLKCFDVMPTQDESQDDLESALNSSDYFRLAAALKDRVRRLTSALESRQELRQRLWEAARRVDQCGLELMRISQPVGYRSADAENALQSHRDLRTRLDDLSSELADLEVSAAGLRDPELDQDLAAMSAKLSDSGSTLDTRLPWLEQGLRIRRDFEAELQRLGESVDEAEVDLQRLLGMTADGLAATERQDWLASCQLQRQHLGEDRASVEQLMRVAQLIGSEGVGRDREAVHAGVHRLREDVESLQQRLDAAWQEVGASANGVADAVADDDADRTDWALDRLAGLAEKMRQRGGLPLRSEALLRIVQWTKEQKASAEDVSTASPSSAAVREARADLAAAAADRLEVLGDELQHRHQLESAKAELESWIGEAKPLARRLDTEGFDLMELDSLATRLSRIFGPEAATVARSRLDTMAALAENIKDGLGPEGLAEMQRQIEDAKLRANELMSTGRRLIEEQRLVTEEQEKFSRVVRSVTETLEVTERRWRDTASASASVSASYDDSVESLLRETESLKASLDNLRVAGDSLQRHCGLSSRRRVSEQAEELLSRFADLQSAVVRQRAQLHREAGGLGDLRNRRHSLDETIEAATSAATGAGGDSGADLGRLSSQELQERARRVQNSKKQLRAAEHRLSEFRDQSRQFVQSSSDAAAMLEADRSATDVEQRFSDPGSAQSIGGCRRLGAGVPSGPDSPVGQPRRRAPDERFGLGQARAAASGVDAAPTEALAARCALARQEVLVQRRRVTEILEEVSVRYPAGRGSGGSVPAELRDRLGRLESQLADLETERSRSQDEIAAIRRKPQLTIETPQLGLGAGDDSLDEPPNIEVRLTLERRRESPKSPRKTPRQFSPSSPRTTPSAISVRQRTSPVAASSRFDAADLRPPQPSSGSPTRSVKPTVLVEEAQTVRVHPARPHSAASQESDGSPRLRNDCPPEVFRVLRRLQPEVFRVLKRLQPEVFRVLKQWSLKRDRALKHLQPEVFRVLKRLQPEVFRVLKRLEPEVFRVLKRLQPEVFRPEVFRVLKRLQPEVFRVLKQWSLKRDRALKRLQPEVFRVLKRLQPEVFRVLKHLQPEVFRVLKRLQPEVSRVLKQWSLKRDRALKRLQPEVFRVLKHLQPEVFRVEAPPARSVPSAEA
uniref:SH3 domain-containing protein n=1 Tax=Macrostomum lignano TaxID=282301 RepID=A0A1I8I875_9PLAT